mmetsp:Transcript_105675/g.315634  ORF Transcript_105675/g.315634 Transcript_105675/m.315634 type:complete len:566 (-) Transcript_105675:69-1766(-)
MAKNSEAGNLSDIQLEGMDKAPATSAARSSFSSGRSNTDSQAKRQSKRASQYSVSGEPVRQSVAVRKSAVPRTTANAMAVGVEPRNSLSALAPGVDEPSMPSIAPRIIAELVGTFMLVFTVHVAVTGKSSFAAFAIGGILAVQVYAFGSVSGACLNPAVTLAVMLSGRKKMNVRDGLCYMATQFLGGLLGGWFGLLFTSSSFYFDVNQTSHQDAGICIMLEILYTAALCTVVLATGTSTDSPNEYFGFAIGGTVLASAIACGSLDQGSFNPAVTLGINIAHLTNGEAMTPSAGSWFLYLVVPFLGSFAGAGVFIGTRLPECMGKQKEEHSIGEKLLAEAVGTFYLVLTAGIASGALAPVAIGVMLAVQVYAFGSVSGACLNPAVTLAVLSSGRNKLKAADAFMYMCVQFFSAVIAGVIAWQLSGKTVHLGEEDFGSTFGIELVFTFALCMTVLTTGTSDDAPNQYFGFAIGGTVTAAAYAAAPHKAGSFNPAVTLGFMFADEMNGVPTKGTSWALFILGPWLGGCLAAAVFYLTRRAEYADQEMFDPMKELVGAMHGDQKANSTE